MKELENLPKFYIGQDVVGLENLGPLRKDAQYKVLDQFQCSCGIWHVGFLPCPTTVLNFNCHGCMKPHISQPLWYCRNDQLAPIQKQNMPLMKFTEILKKEESQILISN